MTITHPGVPLQFTLAAIAKRLERAAVSYFPKPDGHSLPVISSVMGARSWAAEALGVKQDELLDRFRQADNKTTAVKRSSHWAGAMSGSGISEN